MGAHESMEHGEHAEHATGRNKKIALLIAVIALVLAFSETLGKGAQTEAHQPQCRGVQPVGVLPGQDHPPDGGADRRRGPSSAGVARSGKAAMTKQVDDWNKTAARYDPSRKPRKAATQLAERAKQAEESATPRLARYHHFEVASAASRSASCWRRRPSSPAWSFCRGSRSPPASSVLPRASAFRAACRAFDVTLRKQTATAGGVRRPPASACAGAMRRNPCLNKRNAPSRLPRATSRRMRDRIRRLIGAVVTAPRPVAPKPASRNFSMTPAPESESERAREFHNHDNGVWIRARATHAPG